MADTAIGTPGQIDARSWRQCSLLLRLLREATSATDIDSLSTLIDVALREVFGAAWAVLYSADPDGTFSMRAASASRANILPPEVSGGAAEVLQLHSSGSLGREDTGLSAFPGATLGIPIDDAGHRLAWLIVGESTSGQSFDASDAEFLSLLGTLIAPRLAFAEVMATQTVESHTDRLTGLGNARALHQRLEEAIARTNRTGRHVALLLFELDGIRTLEDLIIPKAGWTLGDFGEAVNASIRASDVAFRQRGTVSVLLANADSDGTWIAAERIRNAVKRFGGDIGVKLTASIGGAVLREGLHSPVNLAAVALMKKAEEAMYRAKRAGGDRCLVG